MLQDNATSKVVQCHDRSHVEGLVPGRVEARLDCLRLQLRLVWVTRGQFQFDVRVSQAIGVHGVEVPGFDDCVVACMTDQAR